MPARLWFLLTLLCGAIGLGACLALYAGAQELRLLYSGPRRQLLAEELRPDTAGLVLVLGCTRHDLEVDIDSDGLVVTGERSRHDRVYSALVPASECDENLPVDRLHVMALVEAQDAAKQGLSKLYGQGYVPPPTRVVVEGAMGFGTSDGRREHLARRHFAAIKAPAALQDAPVIVKDRRPGHKGVAYATTAVGVHGLLLLSFILWLAVRRWRSGGLPPGMGPGELDDLDEPPAGGVPSDDGPDQPRGRAASAWSSD